jgi:mRNA-degrading endonuclease HigB of HigAB toxin-antitoxin module
MAQINVPIDPELKKEFVKFIGTETQQEAISRLIMKEIGWNYDTLELKERRLTESVENLQSELTELRTYLQSQLKEKLEYLKSKNVKDMWPNRDERWKDNTNVIQVFRSKGITFKFLYDHWEELY